MESFHIRMQHSVCQANRVGQSMYIGYDWNHLPTLSRSPLERNERNHETHGVLCIPKDDNDCFVLFCFTNAWDLAYIDNVFREKRDAMYAFGQRVKQQEQERDDFQSFLKAPNRATATILSTIRMEETRGTMRMSTLYEIKKEGRMEFSLLRPSRWVVMKLVRGVDFE